MSSLRAVLLVVASLVLAGCNCDPGGGGDAGTDAGRLFVEASFPALTLAPAGDELVVRAGHGTVAEPGLAVTVTVTGGAAATPAGVTDALGEFRTTVAPAALPATGVGLEVTASDGHQAPAVARLDAGILDPGLRATYSTGAVRQEGPIRHGWSGDCGATGNNLYQDVCVAVADSVVNWAWGSFSVDWVGQLRSPVTGSVAFQSYFWVDGVVKVVVDGITVADLDTTGGGYSGTVPLVAGRWVPVSMHFAGNGGSNNMHLGWGGTAPALPGAWQPVPKADLATRR